jgi:hypothetical protein
MAGWRKFSPDSKPIDSNSPSSRATVSASTPSNARSRSTEASVNLLWMGATAMGWTLGFGRLGSMLAPPLLGLIIGAGLSFQWNSYALAVPGILGPH